MHHKQKHFTKKQTSSFTMSLNRAEALPLPKKKDEEINSFLVNISREHQQGGVDLAQAKKKRCSL
jgi:hypothetical protein